MWNLLSLSLKSTFTLHCQRRQLSGKLSLTGPQQAVKHLRLVFSSTLCPY